MIYDCFLFNNELEILEIRLNELNEVVDKFVLVEATVTHTNKPKRLYYNENKHLFKKFNNKIIHIIVKDSPNVTLPWIIERFQFESAVRGLNGCKPNDTILHGPVDEIPRAEIIAKWIKKPGKLKYFNMKLYCYFLNYLEINNGYIPGTRMFNFKYLSDFGQIYFTRYFPNQIEIPDGGWHFSYMGGVDRIIKKLESTTHQELNNKKYNTREKISIAMIKGSDLFGLGWKFKRVEMNELPKYVQANSKKFSSLLLPNSDYSNRINKRKLIVLILIDFFKTRILRIVGNLVY